MLDLSEVGLSRVACSVLAENRFYAKIISTIRFSRYTRYAYGLCAFTHSRRQRHRYTRLSWSPSLSRGRYESERFRKIVRFRTPQTVSFLLISIFLGTGSPPAVFHTVERPFSCHFAAVIEVFRFWSSSFRSGRPLWTTLETECFFEKPMFVAKCTTFYTFFFLAFFEFSGH